MGKKYIIELEDKPFNKGNGEFLYRVKGFNSLVFDMTGVGKLTPYTEPDLEQVRQKAYDKAYADAVCNCSEGCSHIEQVRKEAYKQGRKDVETQFCSYDACKNRQEEYLRGLADAWEAARKILFNPDDGGMSAVDVNEVFGENSWTVMKDFSASEVVAKIKEYEDSKHKIKVGDEVKSGDERYVVLQKYLNIVDEPVAVLFNRRDEEISYFHLYNGNGAIFEKTGKHFPEIAAALAKIKEN